MWWSCHPWPIQIEIASFSLRHLLSQVLPFAWFDVTCALGIPFEVFFFSFLSPFTHCCNNHVVFFFPLYLLWVYCIHVLHIDVIIVSLSGENYYVVLCHLCLHLSCTKIFSFLFFSLIHVIKEPVHFLNGSDKYSWWLSDRRTFKILSFWFSIKEHLKQLNASDLPETRYTN